MTENVEFIRGNDRISQLAQRPDLAEGVARVRRDMEQPHDLLLSTLNAYLEAVGGHATVIALAAPACWPPWRHPARTTAKAPAAMIWSCPGRGTGVLVRRSEEHTSEL